MAHTNNLGFNLKWLMEHKAIRPIDLSSLTGVPAISIRKLRHIGAANPTVDTIFPIAKFFGITAEQLLNGRVEKFVDEKYVLANKEHQLIPLISFSDLVNYPNISILKYISYDYSSTSKLYCFKLEDEDNIFFTKNSILIVDTEIKPTNRDILVVRLKDSNLPSIKKLIIDDSSFLQSTKIGLDNIIPFDIKKYAIEGVIVSCIKNMKE